MIILLWKIFKTQNKTLVEYLNSLYQKYGFYKNTLLNFNFTGTAVLDKMKKTAKKYPVDKAKGKSTKYNKL